MPIVVSNKQRIFFRFEGESGAYLLLHHGLFGSHEDWYRAGYVQALEREFRLVIPDARAHGRSDRPTEGKDYAVTELTDDIACIMNSLGIRNMHFLGHGLGALVGMSLLRRFPERVRIVMLGGESPLMVPSVREHWQGLLEALRQGTLAEAVAGLRARDLVLSGGAAPPEEDRPALLALVEAVAGWEPHGEERINPPSPVALYCGSQDSALPRVEKGRSFIQRARLSIFPGLGHTGVFEERQQLTQELVRLLKPSRREEGGEDSAPQRPGEPEAEAQDAAAPGNAHANDRAARGESRHSERRRGRHGGRGGQRRRGERRRHGGAAGEADRAQPEGTEPPSVAQPDAPNSSLGGADNGADAPESTRTEDGAK